MTGTSPEGATRRWPPAPTDPTALPRVGALVAALAGVLALSGWLFDVPVLRSGGPGLVAMNPATAIGFVLTSAALALLTGSRRRWRLAVATAFAATVTLLGLAKLAALGVGPPFDVDQWLFRGRLASTPDGIPNRMAPNTALGFVLAGLALLALRSDRRPAHAWSQALAHGPLLLSVPALLGYLYGMSAFYRVPHSIPMALNTAIAFTGLALGIVFARPDRGLARLVLGADPAGVLLRRYVPAAVLCVGVIGWASVQGARAGLYDMEFAAGLGDALVIAVIATLALANAVTLAHTERARRKAAAELHAAHRDLEERIARRTVDLERANRELAREFEEHRRSQDAVRRERRFSEQIIASSEDGIVAFDRELRVTEWNPAMTRISGLDRADIVGRPGPEAFPFLLESGMIPKLMEVLSGGTLEVRDQPFEVPETGRRGYFDGRFSAMRDDTGLVTGGVAIVRETTEKRQLERQFLQAQKLEAVGRLAGGVAHDFNNLLTAILGYGELLKERLGAGHPAHRDAEEIVRAAGRGGGLTRQLLLFSRQQVETFQVLDLNEAIVGIDRMLRRLVGEDVDLVTAPAVEPCLIRADAGQIEQVLMNLVVNARDAMPGGGRLTIETAIVTLDEEYAGGHLDVRPGRYVRLAVSDTGTGMSPEVRAQVFEPFFTTKRPGEGTGLGLSTVHGIVGKCGGHVEVYSQPGQGTTFKVYLPVAGPEVVAPPAPAPAPAPARGTETILLVEDEDVLRRLIREALTSRGYRVLEASDGSEAIGLCERHELEIDLLVTDVIMPLMNGPELARRAAAARPGLPVLFLSGYADRALAHRGMLGPTTAFLQKPFSPATLAARVRELLDGPRRAAA